MSRKMDYTRVNKKLILIIGILSLMLLAGCEGGFLKGRKGNAPITDVDIREGFDGLSMQFLQNAPPDNVFTETGFPIAIDLKNNGASDIKDTKGILVIGLETNYAELVKEVDKNGIRFGLNGKSIYNPVGDKDVIEIDARAKRIGEQSETFTSRVSATACYPYKTIFGTSVCVDTDVYGAIKGLKACTVKDLEFDKGQGAPVAVTKVEARMLAGIDKNIVKPHFIIHIENKGNGQVIDPQEGIISRACTKEPLEYKNFNSIQIKVSLSGKDLNCRIGESESEDGEGGTAAGPTTIIRLREKKDFVRCTLEEGIDRGRDAYVTPLKVELDYGYTFTISKNVVIKKGVTY